MKILLPFVDLYDNNINHPMITGGAELFCRHLNNHFDVTVQQIPIGALKYSIRERNRISLDIIEEANEINADKTITLSAKGYYCVEFFWFNFLWC